MRSHKKNCTKNVLRSLAFREKRAHHQSESAEDYTELIADLIYSKGEARTCEIAELLGISHVTAIKTIRRLVRDGYLITTPYRPLALTPKGKRLAKFSKARHELLLSFLLSIGVPRTRAEIDVEGMEHHISAQTLRALRKHLRNHC